jgi:hypothetical protein
MLFLYFFFTRDIFTLISALASASDSDSDSEEELSELVDLFSDSNEEVSLSAESESAWSSTLAKWTWPLLDIFFYLDFDFFCFILEDLQVVLRPLLR